jgi:hypothetical protein
MLSKPPSRKRERERRRAARMVARSECRIAVRHRDGGRCRACGALAVDVHEIPFRSHGGDPTDTRHALCLCRACHDAAHHGVPRLRGVPIDPVSGVDGPVQWSRGERRWLG